MSSVYNNKGLRSESGYFSTYSDDGSSPFPSLTETTVGGNDSNVNHDGGGHDEESDDDDDIPELRMTYVDEGTGEGPVLRR